MSNTTWMINTGGRAIEVDSASRRDLEGRGYKSLNEEPNQKYFPQYDERNGGQVNKMVQIDGLTELLDIEIL